MSTDNKRNKDKSEIYVKDLHRDSRTKSDSPSCQDFSELRVPLYRLPYCMSMINF